MEIGELTEDQWVEIAFRLIFDEHPFPGANWVMTIDRVRSEEFGKAIQRFGGIVPLVTSLANDNTVSFATRQALAALLDSCKEELELQDRVAAFNRREAAIAFRENNPGFGWSKLPGEK